MIELALMSDLLTRVLIELHLALVMLDFKVFQLALQLHYLFLLILEHSIEPFLTNAAGY